MIFVNRRMAGPVLLWACSQNSGLELPCNDGGALKIWADKLVGLDKIYEALSRAEISLPEPEKEGAK